MTKNPNDPNSKSRDPIAAMIGQAAGGDVELATEGVLADITRRTFEDWDAIRRTLVLSRGEGWDDELPLDGGQVGPVGDGLVPALLVFRFADLGLDYWRVPADGAVVEVAHREIEDVVRARIYASNGELLRVQDEPVVHA